MEIINLIQSNLGKKKNKTNQPKKLLRDFFTSDA